MLEIKSVVSEATWLPLQVCHLFPCSDTLCVCPACGSMSLAPWQNYRFVILQACNMSYLIFSWHSRVFHHIITIFILLLSIPGLHKLSPCLQIYLPQPARSLILLTVTLHCQKMNVKMAWENKEQNVAQQNNWPVTLLSHSRGIVPVRLSPYLVERFSIGEHELEVCSKLFHISIIFWLKLILNLCHINWLGYHFVIIWLIPETVQGRSGIIVTLLQKWWYEAYFIYDSSATIPSLWYP